MSPSLKRRMVVIAPTSNERTVGGLKDRREQSIETDEVFFGGGDNSMLSDEKGGFILGSDLYR